MKLGVSEILNKADHLKTLQEKVQFLRQNNSPALRSVLQGALDPRVKWLLPPGVPPYKVNDIHDQQNVLHHEHRKLYLFVEGGKPQGLKMLRCEQLFVELLESLEPDDAKLILACKDKTLPYKTITREVVQAAFPQLFG